MFYLVALGNPGSEYERTRHNVGWLFLDRLRHEVGNFSEPQYRPEYQGRISQGEVSGQMVTLLYPETFMNRSGKAVAALVPPDTTDNLLVIYDDVALPLGGWRVSYERGAGGHNGLKSVIETLGTNQFARLRVGISPVNNETGEVVRPTSENLSDFVLGRFSPSELNKLEATLANFRALVTTFITEGREAAMNHFNS